MSSTQCARVFNIASESTPRRYSGVIKQWQNATLLFETCELCFGGKLKNLQSCFFELVANSCQPTASNKQCPMNRKQLLCLCTHSLANRHPDRRPWRCNQRPLYHVSQDVIACTIYGTPTVAEVVRYFAHHLPYIWAGLIVWTQHEMMGMMIVISDVRLSLHKQQSNEPTKHDRVRLLWD